MKKIVALVLSLVMVLGLATTAFAAADVKIYKQQDNDTTEWNLEKTYEGLLAEYVKEADYSYTDAGMPMKGNLEYYEFQGYAFFTEATKATGTYKLVCGNVTVYVNPIADMDEVEYYAEAEAFTGLTTDDEDCGSLYVLKKNLSKTYYVVSTEKGIPVEYYVKAVTGDTNLLVDGKIVTANKVDTFVKHVWVGNEVDATTKAYTSVICENCGKTATLFANADAAGKYAQYLNGYGWITADAAGYEAAVVETPAADATDKVESAQTFDAGIAMYVGMSVMAAAGSAVVLKKKD